jgi:hypothetical protein
MLFKEFSNHIVELQRNLSITKDFAKSTRDFPSSQEYATIYSEFDKPLLFKTKDDIIIEVRYFTKGPVTYITNWVMVNKTPRCIGMLHLYKRPIYNRYGYDFYEIINSYLKTEYIGKGIMPTTYMGLIKRGINLAALDTQSAGARKMWKNLYGREGIKIWAILGVRLFVSKELQRTKDDFIESISLSDKLTSIPENPDELSAVFMTPDGVESVESVYVDTEGYEEYESLLIMTNTNSKLDNDLELMMNYEQFSNEKNLFNALQKMLLQIKK